MLLLKHASYHIFLCWYNGFLYLVVTHFALRSFTSFRMTTGLYVILSGSEESLLLLRINPRGSK